MSSSALPSTETPPQAAVLGLPLHLLKDYVRWLLKRVQAHQGTHVVTLNAEMAMQAQQNPQLADIIRQAELVVPDGAGVVWYLRLRGKAVRRVPGIELSEALLRQLSAQSASVFFFGGRPGVVEKAAEEWENNYPSLDIAGTQHGYLNTSEQMAFVQQLERCHPDVILVGLGVPRQEFWIAANRHHCPEAIWIGVGGSFDIWAGEKRRAPHWLRNNNLEWVYRLYLEPWRWRRMLALPQFAWKALTHF